MSLFESTSSGDWRANARMDHELDWHLYVLGYEEATKLLLNHTSTGRDQDTLIYPILFNARQAIELGIKEIICLADRLHNLEDSCHSSPLPLGHRLGGLWEKAKALIDQVDESYDAAELDNDYQRSACEFQRLLHQLDDIDPISANFRYPFDKEGKPSFRIEDGESEGSGTRLPHLISTHELRHPLNAMFNFLTGVSEWLTVLTDAITQATAEVGS